MNCLGGFVGSASWWNEEVNVLAWSGFASGELRSGDWNFYCEKRRVWDWCDNRQALNGIQILDDFIYEK